MQLASRYCISSLVAFCEQTVKRFVDYDNVAAIFLISQRCEARQLLAYCAYFSRKYEHHICEAVTPENAMEMSTLARECKLSDLKKVAEPLVSRVDLEHDDVGCGESKSGRDTVTRSQQDEKIICTPKPPPLILSRERMWSA